MYVQLRVKGFMALGIHVASKLGAPGICYPNLMQSGKPLSIAKHLYCLVVKYRRKVEPCTTIVSFLLANFVNL